ncbi:MAG: hypothetical protein EOP85_08000 [Verrucomicrobiaceae bacterium]|nr:MAG: hypothetical protein EOP85_08000 [Verrucomicrobiaceae bacterium]
MNGVSLLLLFSTAGLQIARSAPLNLNISQGGLFHVSYQLDSGQSVESDLHITGDISAEVEMTDGIISRFRFSGGNVAYSDTTNEIIVSTFPFTSEVRLSTRNIVSSVTSNGSSGAIHPFTGVISNSGHRLVQNRGNVTTRYLVNNNLIQESIRDLAADPDSNPMVGVTTVTNTLLERLPHKELHRINFNHTRSETRTQPAEIPTPYGTISGTLNITEDGGFSATGDVWIPSQTFVDWSMATHGQRPTSLKDRSTKNDQPLILLYAFNASGEAWTPPVTFDPAAATVHIHLPSEGLKAPVRLEYNSSLAPTGWTTLKRKSGSISEFGISESGSIAMDTPPDAAGFIRLSLAD